MSPRPGARCNGVLDDERKCGGQTVRYEETLHRLAVIDEGFVVDQAGLELGPARTPTLDARTAALLQLGASVAVGSARAGLKWSAARALAAGATPDEIADVLLVIAPVAGLGRVVCAAPHVAAALGYDVTAALEDPDGT
jgi:4-carboxymuconolactone decarboxylase